MDNDGRTVSAHSHGAADLTLDEVRAELVLAQVAGTGVDEPRGRLMIGAGAGLVVMWCVLAIAGNWLRGRIVPSPLALTIGCGCLLAIGSCLLVLFRALGKEPPKWVRAAGIHQRRLAERAGPEMLSAIEHVRTKLPNRWWMSAQLYVAQCTAEQPVHIGVCRFAGIVPRSGRLLVVVGEHLASGSSPVVSGILAHEYRHVTGWRVWAFYFLKTCQLGGWVIVTWAFPWPVLLIALAVFHVAMTGLSWLIELSCDYGAARSAGADAMVAAFDYTAQVLEAWNASQSPWVRYPASVVKWIAGPPHPPVAVRRALVRVWAPLG